MQDIYLIAITIAIIGVTWIKYLLDPDGLFNFLPPLVEQSLAITKLPEKIMDRITWVLLQCEKCFSGQLALWTYAVLVIQGHPYRFIEHLILVFLSIFFAGAINTILRKMD